MIKKFTFLSMILIFLSSNYTYTSANNKPIKQTFKDVLSGIQNNLEPKKISDNNKYYMVGSILNLGCIAIGCVFLYFVVKHTTKTNNTTNFDRLITAELNHDLLIELTNIHSARDARSAL